MSEQLQNTNNSSLESDYKKKLWWYYSLRSLLLVTGLFCLIFPNTARQFLLFDTLNRGALNVIHEALVGNSRLFFIVSGIKAAIAVIEGSTVGIMVADMQLGDIVQPAYNFIDFVWRILLYSLLILGIYRIFLEIEFFGWGIPIMGVGLLLIGAWWGNPRFQNLKIWGLRIFFTGLFFGYFVPLTLFSSHFLNRHFTERFKEIQAQRIEHLQVEMDEFKTAFLELRADIIPESALPWRWDVQLRFQALNMHLNHIGTRTMNVFQGATGTFLNFLAIIFLEVIFFPIFTAFVIYKASSLILRKLYHIDLFASPAPSRSNSEI